MMGSKREKKMEKFAIDGDRGDAPPIVTNKSLGCTVPECATVSDGKTTLGTDEFSEVVNLL